MSFNKCNFKYLAYNSIGCLFTKVKDAIDGPSSQTIYKQKQHIAVPTTTATFAFSF